jgi:hexosaminidase
MPTPLFAAETPAFPVRALHLDLKGVPPTPERLLPLLDLAARARYNALLVEWEDIFPWTVDPAFRNETAYTAAGIRALLEKAGTLGIEVIPLVQCIGHLEWVLKHEAYAPLREVPWREDVMNPLAAGATDLVRRMVEDVLALQPSPRWFHLGGDEAWTFGSHPDTRAYIEAHGAGALYLKHVEPLLDLLAERGIRPILWHDMMRDWDEASLRALGEKADLCVWHYWGRPETHPDFCGAPVLDRFAAAGIPLWAATAYKGGEGPDGNLPVRAEREANATGWAELAEGRGFAGAVATAWSRYSHGLPQVEPIDSALDALVRCGHILHDGTTPCPEHPEVRAILEDLGEWEGFCACRAVMRELDAGLMDAWRRARYIRTQLAFEEAHPDRRSPRALYRYLEQIDASIARAADAAERMREVFRGRLAPLWIDEYPQPRLDALRAERERLLRDVESFDPERFAQARGG